MHDETTPADLRNDGSSDATPSDDDATISTIAGGERPAAEAMSEAELAEARRYGRQRLYLGLADKLVDVLVLAAIAFLLARPLDAWLSGFIASPVPRLLALFGIVAVIDELSSLPLGYWSGHVLEHRYALSRQSLGGWAWRQAKRFTLSVLLGGALALGLYALIWWVGEYWWLAACGGFFLLAIVAGQLAPVLIIPLFYKVRRIANGDNAAGSKAAELMERLTRLTQGTGLAIDGIYRLDMSSETAKANAMLTGLGRTRRVLLGDTLLSDFSVDEIEVVFAHEIGHHVHRHIAKFIALGLAFSLLAFWLADRSLAWWIGPAYDPHQLPVYALPMLMLVMTVVGLLFEPLQNAVSRHFERQSDRHALAATRRPDAYISAFRKLARMNKADPDPHRLEVLLLHSHPPIKERLAMAAEADAEAEGE